MNPMPPFCFALFFYLAIHEHLLPRYSHPGPSPSRSSSANRAAALKISRLPNTTIFLVADYVGSGFSRNPASYGSVLKLTCPKQACQRLWSDAATQAVRAPVRVRGKIFYAGMLQINGSVYYTQNDFRNKPRSTSGIWSSGMILA
jgi:hypothetical protein